MSQARQRPRSVGWFLWGAPYAEAPELEGRIGMPLEIFGPRLYHHTIALQYRVDDATRHVRSIMSREAWPVHGDQAPIRELVS